MSTAADIPTGDYLKLGFQAWWSDRTPEIIHLTCNEQGITDALGTKPGLRVEISSNPRSANYHPGNFNRLARWLREHGKTAPADCLLGDRRLSARVHHLVGEKVATAAITELPWWTDHSNLSLLTEWLAENDYPASNIAYAVTKPWKYTEEFERAKAELSATA